MPDIQPSARSYPRPSVLVFGAYGPSLEVFRGALVTTLVEQGSAVHVLAAAIDDAIAAKLRARGAAVHTLEIERGSINPMHLIREIEAARRVIRAIAPDLVIAYTIKPIVLAAIVAGPARLLALITGLGFAFTPGPGTKRRIARAAASLLYRFALRRAAIAVFQNPDDREVFQRRHILPRHTRTGLVAGSGVELDRFAAAPLPDAVGFLMASRLLGDKGIREFAWAATRLLQLRPDSVVSLAGFYDQSADGIDQSELGAMVESGVKYLGHLSDVRPAIAACSIYVLPSYREGTPRSVLEAMAMGRAVITTDAPGCRETVRHGENGLLVPPRDAEALLAAMLELADDPARVARMGRASRQLAEEKFDVNAVNRALLAFAGIPSR